MKLAQLPIEPLQRTVDAIPRDALSGVREAALARFAARGFPTTRDEEWKYTDLSPAAEISRQWLERGAPALPADDWQGPLDEARRLVDADWFVIANGRVVETPRIAADSITVSRIGDVDPDMSFEKPLADLNAALLTDGLRIAVQAGAEIERPIGLLLVDEVGEDTAVSQTRIVIEASRDSRVAFVELGLSSGEAGHYANVVSDMTLDDGARVDYVRLQRRAAHHCQTQRTAARLARASRLRYSGFDIGGRLIRNDLDVELAGPGAGTVIDGLYLAGRGQHVDNHVRVDHKVGPATSEQQFRGILGADCRCVWNGKVIVHAGADGTDADQSDHNLLLTTGSEVDAKPELEIYADDVKCSHGTTVGQLDEDALFYLRTRGLDRNEAAGMLTRAFGADIVRRVPVTALTDSLAAIVEARLSEITREVDS